LWNEETSSHDFGNGFRANSFSTSSGVSGGVDGVLASGGASYHSLLRKNDKIFFATFF